MEPKIQNKDQVIYNLREQIRQLEATIKILEHNVREETKAKYEAMKSANQTARATEET